MLAQNEVTDPKVKIHADRLIIATNRGPVEYYVTRDQDVKSRRGSGGVVTALLGALKDMQATWVAIAMTEGDRKAFKDASGGVLPSPLGDRDMQLCYVTVPPSVYRNYYDRISNQTLWFVQHYLADFARSAPDTQRVLRSWQDYRNANQAIAEAVIAEIERERSSAVVMLHDYHLYLAPAMIRKQHPAIVMQHFIHIPWPEIRYWQSMLPTQVTAEIFEGLLGNDCIGFQTLRDAHNFLEGVRTLYSDAEVDVEQGSIVWQGHHTLVRDYPISISVEEERKVVQSRAGRRALEQLRPQLKEYVVVRVDRIEPTKNIVLGFHAYRHLLEHHHELHKHITFLAFLVPSREGVSIYRKYKDEIMQVIEEINQRFGKNAWTPVQAFVQNDRTQALAAMQEYDVLLVNSLFDGMNLVAKEGAVVNHKDGVLVLSRTSGAFQQLEQACIPVSPTDTVETAEALFRAITMPKEERHTLAERARQEVEAHNLNYWIVSQIQDINALLDQQAD